MDQNNGVIIKKPNPITPWFPVIVIILSLILSFALFYNFFGSPDNFEGGNADEGHPINFFGIIYKGGAVIPIGMTLLVMLLVIVIERFIVVYFMASGKGNDAVFVRKVRMMLAGNDLQGADEACDAQGGSVANVIKEGLRKYREMDSLAGDKEVGKAAIQQTVEEATALELPGLERNLVIIATTASVGVLVGLIGTVIGMIKAFSAMADGVPDPQKLAVGISEALVNTALGITTSTISIIFYNLFTTKIDKITYAIDEAGYSIVQTYDVKH